MPLRGRTKKRQCYIIYTPPYVETRLVMIAIDLSLIILKEYYEYMDIFREEMSINALLEHRKWDHQILVEEGRTIPFLLIYQILEKDLGTLREYININLKKGFIRPFTSLIRALIYFALKKDGKLRLYINYYKLNAIIIKD